MREKKAKPDGKTDYRFLKAVDITPKDDAFHGNINLLDTEWCYFDAVFDNRYSLHVGMRTYHIRNSGIVQSRINVYKEGKTEIESMKTNLFSNFYPHMISHAYLLMINQSSNLTRNIIKKSENGDITFY